MQSRSDAAVTGSRRASNKTALPVLRGRGWNKPVEGASGLRRLAASINVETAGVASHSLQSKHGLTPSTACACGRTAAVTAGSGTTLGSGALVIGCRPVRHRGASEPILAFVARNVCRVRMSEEASAGPKEEESSFTSLIAQSAVGRGSGIFRRSDGASGPAFDVVRSIAGSPPEITRTRARRGGRSAGWHRFVLARPGWKHRIVTASTSPRAPCSDPLSTTVVRAFSRLVGEDVCQALRLAGARPKALGREGTLRGLGTGS